MRAAPSASHAVQDHMLDNNLRTETIIRSGIKKFPAEVGQLWCALADFHIRLGRFEVARDVYEEGITSVATVKDFTQIFDAYAHFEESLLTAKVCPPTSPQKSGAICECDGPGGTADQIRDRAGGIRRATDPVESWTRGQLLLLSSFA